MLQRAGIFASELGKTGSAESKARRGGDINYNAFRQGVETAQQIPTQSGSS
jgi:hypothetical protein